MGIFCLPRVKTRRVSKTRCIYFCIDSGTMSTVFTSFITFEPVERLVIDKIG